ncbi:MAG: hypothetical protein WCF17_21560 [Terracidiphilus sp.]
MRSNPVLVVLSVVLWLPMSSIPAVAQSTPQQPPKKAASAQSSPLTPQEREAQKHYRVALEAIKNNDFSMAADELKAASEFAPRNALIWYNLAGVESKKGDTKSALEHPQETENLAVPTDTSQTTFIERDNSAPFSGFAANRECVMASHVVRASSLQSSGEPRTGCCCLLKDEGPPPAWDCTGYKDGTLVTESQCKKDADDASTKYKWHEGKCTDRD